MLASPRSVGEFKPLLLFRIRAVVAQILSAHMRSNATEYAFYIASLVADFPHALDTSRKPERYQ